MLLGNTRQPSTYLLIDFDSITSLGPDSGGVFDTFSSIAVVDKLPLLGPAPAILRPRFGLIESDLGLQKKKKVCPAQQME